MFIVAVASDIFLYSIFCSRSLFVPSPLTVFLFRLFLQLKIYSELCVEYSFVAATAAACFSHFQTLVDNNQPNQTEPTNQPTKHCKCMRNIRRVHVCLCYVYLFNPWTPWNIIHNLNLDNIQLTDKIKKN